MADVGFAEDLQVELFSYGAEDLQSGIQTALPLLLGSIEVEVDAIRNMGVLSPKVILLIILLRIILVILVVTISTILIVTATKTNLYTMIYLLPR